MINRILLVVILTGIISTIFPQNSFRNAVLLTHSSGSRLYDYAGYMNNPDSSFATSVPDEMDAYNNAHGYLGADTVGMVKRWFPTDPYGTDWINWLKEFRGEIAGDDIWVKLDTFNVIIIKGGIQTTVMTGYGSSADTSGPGVIYRTIYNYKWIWREIVRLMEAHPDKFFVIMTGSASGDENNTPTGARLAHEFAVWAKDTLVNGNDPVYGAFPENVYVFDYFHYLADNEYYLKDNYESGRQGGIQDDHPNATACNDIAPIFVQEVFDAAIAYESFAGGTTFQFTMQIQNGWNMVSVPGLHPANQNVSTWWPNRNLSADVYKWTTTYEPVTFTNPGEGYWMLHSGNQTYNTGDEWPASGIQIVAHDPIPLTAGWNIIGGYENNPLVNELTTTPLGLIVPNTTYGWDGTYFNATNLVPGFGYCIRSTGNGVINPPTLAEGSAKIVAQDDNSEWGKITITDASGKGFTLYAVSGGGVNLDHYQMPPLPPAGMFDVRYGSNRKAENLKENNQTIEMRGLVYPVTVRAEKMGIKLQDETGKIVSERLKSGEEVVISNSSINKLIVSGDIIPDKYTLEQNYPNPFNPSTKIEFSIPDEVNNVTLTIFNTLGQKVSELVNSKLEAGKYSYVWNASNTATGVYIYELRTDKFVSVKKMLLFK